MNSSAYLILSAIIGFLQVVDAAHLYQRRGLVSKWAILFSFFEFVWACVSYFSDLAAVPPWLPFSFILYVILGYIVGSFALDKEALENPYALVVPKSLVYGGGIFGAYFAATSIYLLLFT